MEKIRRYIISVMAMLVVAVSLCSCRDDKDMPDASDLKKKVPGVWKFEGEVDDYGQIAIFAKFGELYALNGKFEYFQAFHKADSYEYYDFTKHVSSGGLWGVSDRDETIWSNGPYKMILHVASVVLDDPSEPSKGGRIGIKFNIQSIGAKRMVSSIVMRQVGLRQLTFHDLEFKKSTEKEMNEFREQVIAGGKDIDPRFL